MKIIIMIVILAGAGWYGNSLYQQQKLPFLNSFLSDSAVVTKCITKSGRILYGAIPEGVVCDRVEAVDGTVMVVSGQSPDDESDTNSFLAKLMRSSFRCDGRRYCSQMTSCEEAIFFLENCSGVKMDGGNDGVPCERQWCH